MKINYTDNQEAIWGNITFKEAIWRNITFTHTKKPYPGLLAIYPGLPEKIYVGKVNETVYLEIVTNESDEMFGLLLRNIKIIQKEKGQLERLRAIQKTLI